MKSTFQRAGLLISMLLFLVSCGDLFSPNKKKDGELIYVWKDPHPLFGDLYPSWSPDGSTIAYVHVDTLSDGPSGIFFVDPDGNNKRLFLPNATSPDWSPDGKKLVVKEDKYSGLIYTINVDTHEKSLPFVEGNDPKWSPDGNMIAYRVNTGDKSGIWIYDVTDKSKKWVTEKGVYFDWDYTNERLIISSWSETEEPCLLSIDIDSGELETISRGYLVIGPVLSPDGKFIAFGSEIKYGSVRRRGMFIMSRKGGNLPQYLGGEGWEGDPSWSPDGSKIVYEGLDGRYPTESWRRALWIMAKDGNEKKQVTFP